MEIMGVSSKYLLNDITSKISLVYRKMMHYNLNRNNLINLFYSFVYLISKLSYSLSKDETTDSELAGYIIYN